MATSKRVPQRLSFYQKPRGQIIMKNGMSVRKFLTQNPRAVTKAVMRATGASAKSVYAMRWKLRKEQEGKVIDLTRAGSPIRPKARLATSADFPKHDPVNHPAHYTTGGIETIDFIEAKKLNYNLGNVVKYITRADHKGNRIEDLKKAKWYLEREILSQHI
jgi:hypothetical protein